MLSRTKRKSLSRLTTRYKQTVVVAARRAAARSPSARGSAWAWATRRKPKKSPTTSCGKHDAAMMLYARRRASQQPEDLEPGRTEKPKGPGNLPQDYAITRSASATDRPAWDIAFAREFDMTNDSKHFPPMREMGGEEATRRICSGRWYDPDRHCAIPIYQGAMFYHFCPAFQSYGTSSAKNDWAANSIDNLVIGPRFLIKEEEYRTRFHPQERIRIALRDITSNTNERTLVCSLIPAFPTGHTTPVFRLQKGDTRRLLALAGLVSCLVIDYVARASMTGSHMSFFIFSELPLPLREERWDALDRIAVCTARLSLLHRYFAPEWMRLRHLHPDLAAKAWKHWWAVTEADRLRLRVEIDALCADLYGLDPDDFDWIVRDDPTDPKGFYRVDRSCHSASGLPALPPPRSGR